MNRRDLLKSIAALTVGALIPSSLASAASFGNAPKPLPLMPPHPRTLDMAGIVQRLDVFLLDMVTHRELDMCYSGPKIYHTAVIGNEEPLYFDDERAMLKGVAKLIRGRREVGVEYGKSVMPDRIGDVLRKCGAEPDWEATKAFRLPWEEAQRHRFYTEAENPLFCPVCGSLDVDMTSDTFSCHNKTCGAVWKDSYIPERRHVSDCAVAEDSWEMGSDWPLPLVVTKCGHRIWFGESKWVIDQP